MNPQRELKNRKVDHLILLVGGNPLPNAVSGQILLRGGGKITLVCSEGTRGVAADLKEWFEKHGITVAGSVQIAEANPENIHTEVQLIAADGGSIGLNYTGGTKAMAVHAHRAFRDVMGSKATYTASYLDARTLRIVFDDGVYFNAAATLLQPFDLQDFVDLHPSTKLNPCNLPLTKAWLPQTAAAIAKSYRYDRQARRMLPPSSWRRWYGQNLLNLNQYGGRHDLRDGRDNLLGWRHQNWVNRSTLEETTIPFPEGQIGRILKKELAEDYAYVDDELNIGRVYEAISESSSVPESFQQYEMEELCGWFSAKWLEHHVAASMSQTGLFDSVHIGVETVLKEDNRFPVAFELDVVGIRGYQLFAISCSTGSDFGDMKQKLFEVSLRARQLGGDEARIGLVCMNNQPRHIQNESRATIDRRIRVFGTGTPNHLHNLQTHIKAWVEGR